MKKLITLDMDGTLLSSKQTITEQTRDAIRDAAESGKEVALCTGRSLSELKDYADLFTDVHYAILVSGGLVYDLWEKQPIYRGTMDPETVLEAIRIVNAEDTMIQFLETELFVQKDKCLNVGLYHMGEYRDLLISSGTLVDDLISFYEKAPFPVAKMNVYHRDVKAKERNRSRLLKADLPIVIKNAELTSLELSDESVNKGMGLQKLCSHLNIPLEETVCVGDSDNDSDVLKLAGTPVAMGNALPEIKELVLSRGGIVVPDNDHDGCAEAIRQLLLS